MGLLGLGMMTACTNEDEATVTNSGNEGDAYAQIAISVASSSSTNTRTETNGDSGTKVDASESENNIQSLTIVLADKNGIAQQVVNPELKSASSGNQSIRTTEPFSINSGKYFVYVLANYRENQEKLSPVIIGSTNMKQVFTINHDKGALSNNSAFFMVNADEPTETDFTGKASDQEIDGTGGPAANPKTLHLLEIDIERVVSKVTFNNKDSQAFKVKDGETTVATTTLEGVSLINLNTKMFMVKKMANISPEEKSWDSWFYVEDPNYTVSSLDDFYQKKATAYLAPNAAELYCPENTMSESAQLNGQTTGVVYKTKYVPEAVSYSILTEDGTDTYSKMFTEVLGLNPHGSITANMFNENLEDETAPGSFYVYKGLIFKNRNAAWLYCAIDENLANGASAANVAYGNYITNNGPADVHLYEGGICYYTAWIKHNPKATVSMEAGKYGTVRNHWYELTVTSIKGLGHYEPTYKVPTDPDDPEKATIQVKVTVKKWVLVKQDVTLE